MGFLHGFVNIVVVMSIGVGFIICLVLTQHDTYSEWVKIIYAILSLFLFIVFCTIGEPNSLGEKYIFSYIDYLFENYLY